MDTLAYTYTSVEEIERLMSKDGLELMQDDSDATPTGNEVDRDLLETEIIYEATDKVDFYVQGYYAPEDISQNVWVRRRATWIAAYLYTRRRANPGYYTDRYEEAISDLEKIHDGTFQIPRAAQRSVMVPSVSNLSVDDRFWYDKLRVETISSVGPVDAGRQRLASVYPYDTFF